MSPGRLQVAIAIDFSEHADVALGEGLTILLPRTAVIDLVHVVELAMDVTLEGHTLATSASMLAWTTAELDKRLTIVRELGFPCAAHTLRGLTDRQIIRFVRDRSTDLLVMGSRGRGHSREALGSTAASILRQRPCSILFMPVSR